MQYAKSVSGNECFPFFLLFFLLVYPYCILNLYFITASIIFLLITYFSYPEHSTF